MPGSEWLDLQYGVTNVCDVKMSRDWETSIRGALSRWLPENVLCSSLIPPSQRRRGATAVLVRHKPQWHRHGRRGSAEVPSLIAVAPRKTVKTADLRSGTAETLNMFKTSAESPRVGPIRNGIATATPWPQRYRGLDQSPMGSLRHRHDRRGIVQGPQ